MEIVDPEEVRNAAKIVKELIDIEQNTGVCFVCTDGGIRFELGGKTYTADRTEDGRLGLVFGLGQAAT